MYLHNVSQQVVLQLGYCASSAMYHQFIEAILWVGFKQIDSFLVHQLKPRRHDKLSMNTPILLWWLHTCNDEM